MSDLGGRVVSLWRYPVKSMLGEQIDRSEVTDRGLVGDRAFGLIDVELSKLATAKRPRLWGKLFEFRASLDETRGGETPVVVVTLPDGSAVRTDDSDADARVSQALGREVRFASQAPPALIFDEDWLGEFKGDPYGPVVPGESGETVMETLTALGAPSGTFFDFSPVHLITTASLEALRRASPQSTFDVRRFRPNIVIDVGGEGFPENEWGDRTIAIGDGVRLTGVVPVPRCVMTTLPQGDLPKDSGVLRAAAEHNRVEVGALGHRPCVGLYADVGRGGNIRAGDSVRIE